MKDQDIDKKIREQIKNDQINFDQVKNLQAIRDKINSKKEKQASIIPLHRGQKKIYWLVAAAMTALMFSFGIENWSGQQHRGNDLMTGVDSILDSSFVQVDTNDFERKNGL